MLQSYDGYTYEDVEPAVTAGAIPLEALRATVDRTAKGDSGTLTLPVAVRDPQGVREGHGVRVLTITLIVPADRTRPATAVLMTPCGDHETRAAAFAQAGEDIACRVNDALRDRDARRARFYDRMLPALESERQRALRFVLDEKSRRQSSRVTTGLKGKL